MKGKGTTDAIFMARQMQKNFRVKGKKLYFDVELKSHVCSMLDWKWDLAYKERKCGGTSASRDENGQVDVWRLAKRQTPK